MADRYKKRGLKFNNAVDSRVLRAVHNHQRQRGCRDDVVNTRRHLKGLENSPLVADPPKSHAGKTDKQAMQHQKGLERYQQLLKWKEMKKKQLEKEKKKRMPSFKTGIFQPNPPKFLVSDDNKEFGKTPQASMKKKTATPGATLRKVPVFHLGCTPATSLLRVPQFHTGLTPAPSSKKQIFTTKKPNKEQDQGVARRTRAAHKNEGVKAGRRTGARGPNTRQRKYDKEEDLGVHPLPVTPLALSKKVKKPVPSLQGLALPSFAPADFAFNFEVPQILQAGCPTSGRPNDSVVPPLTEPPQHNVKNKEEQPENQLNDGTNHLTCTANVSPETPQNSPSEESEDSKPALGEHNETQSGHQDSSPSKESDTSKAADEHDSEELAELNDSPSEESNHTGASDEHDSEELAEQNDSPSEESNHTGASDEHDSEELAEHQDNSLSKESDTSKVADEQDREVHATYQETPTDAEEVKVCVSESDEYEALSTLPEELPSPPQDNQTHIPYTSEWTPKQESDSENRNGPNELLHDSKAFDIPEAVKDAEISNKVEMDDAPCVDEQQENTERNTVVYEEDRPSPGNTHTLEPQSEEKPLKKSRRSSRANTPAKHLTRRSVACCFDDSVTPTVSRLRPRTPCSRSTRRSLSAHCDSPQELYTPRQRSSARKTPRRSVSKAATLNNLDETLECLQPALLDEGMSGAAGSGTRDSDAGTVNTTLNSEQPNHLTTAIDNKLKACGQKESFSPLMTPENVFRREHGMWTVETSPWISARRPKKNKKAQFYSFRLTRHV